MSKIAVISDQLAGAIGGSESILFALLDLYPDLPVYTTVLNPDIIPDKYKKLNITTSFIQKLPLSKKVYKAYFPLMPLGVELFNLQKFDIVFSSHHSVAKGIIPRPDATHICYCHSPARYIWDMFWTYSDLNNFNTCKKIFVSSISQYLRIWDVTSACRVDYFLANSTYTSQRIKKFYNRDSEILYPPVETDKFNFETDSDFYLMAGRLVAYKGYELAIEAFNNSGKKLIIIGDGPEFLKLKSKANSNITFLGRVNDDILINHFNNCKAFIFPGKEDFGIVMAEAQAAGKPVIAFKGGGALDIVCNRETGILFDNQNSEDLNKAIHESETTNWNHQTIRNNSLKFDVKLFKNRLKEIIDNAQNLKRL